MKASPPEPPESNFYKFLQQLIQQNRGSADNTGLVVLGILIGFFAFVLTTIVVVKLSTPLPSSEERTTIMDTRSNP